MQLIFSTYLVRAEPSWGMIASSSSGLAGQMTGIVAVPLMVRLVAVDCLARSSSVLR
jgi:hypothetical protein